MKQTWYPRPHDMTIIYGHGMESAVVNNTTIVPYNMYDEGLGTPINYNANPEHASFVEVNMPNSFPDSTINMVVGEISFSLTKGAIETDKVVAVRCGFMPIFTTFDDIIAADEVSTLDISEVLELQREATDRQSYPLFNTVKMKAGISAATTLHANVPGLT